MNNSIFKPFSLSIVLFFIAINSQICFSMCSPTPGCLGGVAFEDFNFNGTEDSEEVGVQGVIVSIYDATNTLIATVNTDASGAWQQCGLTDGESYRVEYILPASISCWASPTHTGLDNGTDVQFVVAPNCTKFSIGDPTKFTDDTNSLVLSVSCYEGGTGDGPNSGNAAFVSFDNDSNGNTVDPNYDITIGEIGSVWGSSYDVCEQRVFTASVLKRHVGLGDGLGYLYVLDYSNPSAPNLAQKIDLEGAVPANTGVAISFGQVCRDASCANDPGNTGNPADYELSNDPEAKTLDLDAFYKVGKVGYGDVEYDAANELLWFVNLYERTLISMDVSGTLPGQINSYPISGGPGAPTCTNGELRPWALAIHQGIGYLGTVCDATTTNNFNDLDAHVLSFDIKNPSAGFSLVQQVDLTEATRVGSPPIFSGPGFVIVENKEFQAWSEDYNDLPANFRTEIESNTPQVVGYRGGQPILSDLDFDTDGNLLVSILDRTSLQIGFNQRAPNNDPTITNLVTSISYGDLFKYCTDGAGGYIKEGATGCTPTNFNTDDFFDLRVGDGNADGTLGSVTVIPGTNEVVALVYDPFPIGGTFGPPYLNTQGVHWFNQDTGAKTDWYTLISETTTSQNFAKGQGLGNIEAHYPEAPIEIGNYVWCDTIENGIQDATEESIDGLLVQLYDRNGVLVGQTNTVNGNYLFNQTNVDTTGINANGTPMNSFTGLSKSTQYFLVYGNGQFLSGEFTVGTETYYGVTTVNAGVSDQVDSDVDGSVLSTALNQMPSGLPFHSFETPRLGCSNHKFDLGLICIPPCPPSQICMPISITKN